MNLTLAYRGRSSVATTPTGLALALAPNLRRDRVSFDGTLRHPVRFREALGALHDVVVGDFKFAPKDHSAYKGYLAEQAARLAAIRRGAAAQAGRAAMEATPSISASELKTLRGSYKRMRSAYWSARQRYSDILDREDPQLWRLLVPCDPVITVAPDCLFFECFSADESSYGSLTVDRDAFSAERDAGLGTTNVDYSWALYERFQLMRSYRETRFLVDPAGFAVRTSGDASYREEKIDLPPSWLRGFMTLQAALSLPMRRVPVSREGLYNVLAFLRRHKAARSPRAIRYELEPGKPVAIVMEPWERRIVLHGTPYEGPRPEVVRTWGRDRLRVLARLLPLVDGAEVYLLGTGFPSVWSVRMGEMRLTLGLSGWTANDWTGGSALDQLAPPAEPPAETIGAVAGAFRESPALPFEAIRARADAPAPQVAAALVRLARLGQVIHDLPAGLYRWRQIMPPDLAMEQVLAPSPETEAARRLAARLTRDERRPDGLHILEGEVGERPASLLLDADGRMLRGRCTCSHHHTGGLRRGPCRHLQALRSASYDPAAPAGLDAWFASVAPR